MTNQTTTAPLFTFTQRVPSWIGRRTRIEMNQAFYQRCWNCGHRCGHHADYLFNSRCTLAGCDCNIR